MSMTGEESGKHTGYHNTEETPRERRDGDRPAETVGIEKGEHDIRCKTVVDVTKLSQERDTATADEDFPDGGLRAWLVVVGVSNVTSLIRSQA